MKNNPINWLSVRLALPIILLSSLLGSCSLRESSSQRLEIATTIEPTASIIKSIGDSLVNVSVLLPQGSTPETYEPSTKEIQLLAESKAYLYIGDLGFEKQWLPRIQQIYPSLSLVNLGSEIEHSHHQAHHDITHDPHYWTSIEGIRAIAEATYHSLSRLDSVHQADYTQGYEQLSRNIDSLEMELRQQLKELPSRSFVIYHPSLTKFTTEFGLRQLVIEEDGKAPSPQHLATLITQAKEAGVRVVFIQEAFDTRLTQTIAQELGAKTISINPLSSDWMGQIRLITQALVSQ